MCAISGIVNLDPRNTVDPRILSRMTDIMSHRGPDGRGLFVDRNVGLGHRRLSIIDVATGAQPMFNEDGSVVTVFNGEIYNFEDLTSDLSAAGHVFGTRCDTEAIVHAYEEYGDDCVSRFRGMFAFALWDRNRRRLLIARDRLGVKPLYYYQGPKFFAFASEIKALLQIPEVPCEVDLDALSLYSSLRYVPGPRTMFKNIFKLQPGHLLTLEGRSLTIRKFWDIQFKPSECSEEQLLEQMDELLTESVRLRLVAEVPLGVFLSGGLDSTAILATMSRLRKAHGIDTFSVGYQARSREESEANEFEFARIAAEASGAQHHECRIGPNDVRDILPELVWHLDEPLADPTCVPLYFLSKAARERITVVLSGEGADEILGGYSIYSRMLQMEAIHQYGGRMLPGLATLLRPFVREERYRAALNSVTVPLHARYRGVSRAFLPDLKDELLSWDSNRRSSDHLAAVFESQFHGVSQASPLDRMLYVDMRIWLPDDLLLKADKMTMAHGLELRVPFLDHRMVEFAAKLPESAKLQKSVGKVLLRRLMSGKVPAPILNRIKKGFPVPTGHWLRKDLRDSVHDALLSNGSAVRDYMRTDVIQRVVDQHEKGTIDREREIWTLMVFEHWHRRFMGSTTSESETAYPMAVGEAR